MFILRQLPQLDQIDPETIQIRKNPENYISRLLTQLEGNRLLQYLVVNLQFFVSIELRGWRKQNVNLFLFAHQKSIHQGWVFMFVTHVGIVKPKPIGIDQSKQL